MKILMDFVVVLSRIKVLPKYLWMDCKEEPSHTSICRLALDLSRIFWHHDHQANQKQEFFHMDNLLKLMASADILYKLQYDKHFDSYGYHNQGSLNNTRQSWD